VASSALLQRLAGRQANRHDDDDDDDDDDEWDVDDDDDDDDVTNAQAAPLVAAERLHALAASRAACKFKLDVCVAKSGF
jgi:hypothetical protein